ncbi:cryptochrome/photolyase family protein [Rhodohalobacter sulfatireducens]|uniref:Cryptochrome/photolyase family protein n=1 Tax=Rhodohalobacter sulfatireducens TaxID=2911366 RepID=A0ABS9KDH1_9BACT|nr:cryptochrome/photolyase family protein [Rhodohalobacter sulfatireducens]MCG2588896.1 cryptochrome/photolyase family protein [Rhodohalobacter sulfatireducens]
MSRPYLKQIDQTIHKPNLNSFDKAIFILHDQLNLEAWPDWIKKEKPLLIFIESKEKGESLPYHKQKLTYVLSSMRHFAIECTESGFNVLYHSTEGHYDDGLSAILDGFDGQLTFMTPSEWETRERLRSVKSNFENQVQEIPNSFFLADVDQWKDKIGPNYRMEYFYREIRKQTGYLMDGDDPEGGEWNYDEDNRESLPKNHPLPEFPLFEPDEITKEVMQLIDETFTDHFGELNRFEYAVTRDQACTLLDDFIENRLDKFGPYEDALKTGNHKLFHSQLSLYLNNGLLLPAEVCERALEAYHKGNARLNSVEGFIRQIIGWREFIRIYYEAMMPDVRDANHFGFTNKLPSMFWTGKTKLKCMEESVKPVIEEGYSHHIQRLMILSNFSNLTETDPRELNRWFWFAYIDAYEWVELPNVLGMSTFADGGVLASKPYVSSGNYINKMSDYCKHCEYSVTKKTGENACPFNYLYWNFVDKQRDTFNDSGRVNFMVNMFDNRKSDQEKEAIRESTERFLADLDRES